MTNVSVPFRFFVTRTGFILLICCSVVIYELILTFRAGLLSHSVSHFVEFPSTFTLYTQESSHFGLISNNINQPSPNSTTTTTSMMIISTEQITQSGNSSLVTQNASTSHVETGRNGTMSSISLEEGELEEKSIEIDEDETRLAQKELEEINAVEFDPNAAPIVHDKNSTGSGPEKDSEIDRSREQAQGFRGIPFGYDQNGYNVTRISFLLLRVMRSFNIHSVVEFPCSNTLHWMPALVERLDFEVTNFKYIGLDTHYEDYLRCKKAFEHVSGNLQFDMVTISRRMKLPEADLFFSLDGMQRWGLSSSWFVLHSLRRSGIRNAMFTNNPGVLNTGQKNTSFVNVRRPPFHLLSPQKAIRNIVKQDDENTDPDAIPHKVLYFYQVDKMRPGVI